MKTYKNVSEYIRQAPKAYQSYLNEVRAFIQASVSEAEESIRYGMPAYKWKGKPLFYFAAMKEHLGLYPTSGPIATLQSALTKFSTSKGCVRIPWNKPIPKTIIKKLLAERKKEIRSEQ